jgi:hypothetical protein
LDFNWIIYWACKKSQNRAQKEKRARKNNPSRLNKKEQGKIILAAQIKKNNPKNPSRPNQKISLPLWFRLSLRRCFVSHAIVVKAKLARFVSCFVSGMCLCI